MQTVIWRLAAAHPRQSRVPRTDRSPTAPFCRRAITGELIRPDARVVMPKHKETVTMRLDADLLTWFRRERGYQTRINAILRAYMNAHFQPSNAPRGR
jgi:uncharacterized protein (DUF4415 family)